jgi:hypothetical protein
MTKRNAVIAPVRGTVVAVPGGFLSDRPVGRPSPTTTRLLLTCGPGVRRCQSTCGRRRSRPNLPVDVSRRNHDQLLPVASA